MNRYCESLMGSFSQTSNESWFPWHDGINDQQRVCVRRGFPVIHRLGTAAWQLGNRYCESLWVTWQTVSPLAVMHYVVLAFTFPRSYLWMLPCCFVPFSVLMSAFPARSESESRFNGGVNVSQHPDGFSEKPRFATDPGLPSLMVCVVTALFCAFVCNKFLPVLFHTSFQLWILVFPLLHPCLNRFQCYG